MKTANSLKKIKYTFIKILILCFIFSINSMAQFEEASVYSSQIKVLDTIPKIEILSEYRDSSIFIRWAPTDASSWYQNIVSGYKIFRVEVKTEKGIPIMETIDSFEIKPWSEEVFKTLIDSENKNILIAAQCMYGDWNKHLDLTSPELLNRYSFAMFTADMDWEAAKSLGLAFEDKNIDKGKTYFYRILPMVRNTRLKTGYLSIKAIDTPKPYPLILNALENQNVITIQWSRSIHEEYFSAYFIEKSEDGENYFRLNQKPFVGGISKEFPSDIFSYSDSVSNYIPYYYRIIGLTPFGKLSKASKAIKAIGRDKTPPKKPKNITIQCDAFTQNVILNWDSVKSKDLKNYAIYRSEKSDGEYQLITRTLLDKSINTFTTKIPDINKYFYYKISSIDTAGNYNLTLPFLAAFRDTIAPTAPIGLIGSIDSSGQVSLTWKNNKENDLAGYHVYMANDPTHIFVKISSHTLPTNSWIDTITLKTFTENIYYKITAIDFKGHFSEFSETIKLKKPDIIPPFPPSINDFNYNHLDNTITIHWTPSRSSDLDNHKLFKKINHKWVEVNDFIDTNYSIIDSKVEPGKVYSYKIIAVDDDGLFSNSKAMVVIHTTNRKLPSTPEIISCVYTDKNTIKINWNPVKDKKHYNYIIYRSVNNGNLTVLTRLKNECQFINTDIKENHQYSYAMKQSWDDGKKSKMSDKITPN